MPHVPITIELTDEQTPKNMANKQNILVIGNTNTDITDATLALMKEHDLILTESQMDDIIIAAAKVKEKFYDAIQSQIPIIPFVSRSVFCWHKWIDIDPIGVDIMGGYHRCIKCKSERYIYWGLHYRILKLLGKIEY